MIKLGITKEDYCTLKKTASCNCPFCTHKEDDEIEHKCTCNERNKNELHTATKNAGKDGTN